MNLSSPLSRLRLIGLIEGISCVLLFFVAMPLKYAHRFTPFTSDTLAQTGKSAVTVIGGVHGALWLLFILAVVHVWMAHRWPLGRVLLAGIASLPPGGTFLLDRNLRREQQNRAAAPAHIIEK